MKRRILPDSAKEIKYVSEVSYKNELVFMMLNGDFGKLEFRSSTSEYCMICITRKWTYPWNIGYHKTENECISAAIDAGAMVFSFDTAHEAITWMYETSKVINSK